MLLFSEKIQATQSWQVIAVVHRSWRKSATLHDEAERTYRSISSFWKIAIDIYHFHDHVDFAELVVFAINFATSPHFLFLGVPHPAPRHPGNEWILL